MGDQLKLNKTWKLGERIGAGGFGQVYAARNSQGEAAVVKLVPKEPGAQREMLFVDLSGVRNVIPIIDSGETAGSWVLVMPRADESLRAHLNGMPGPRNTRESVAILTDIATALTDLDGKIVHRGLKPENVLLLNNAWCLADFGISRYSEASTAPDTHKYSMSPPYAAPERWRRQRATSAADSYAFGVIAYELVSGVLPFDGPDMHDFAEQHLHRSAAQLTGIPDGLAALIEECLYKAPEARPTGAVLLQRLGRAKSLSPLPGLAKLQSVHHAEVQRQADAARQQSTAESQADRRADLLSAAQQGLRRVSTALKESILEAAPSGRVVSGSAHRWSIELNAARLEYAAPTATSARTWGSWKPPSFDVVAHAVLSLRVPPGRAGYEGRSHSLWYCDAHQPGTYQWFETAFMLSPLVAARPPQNPFALEPSENAAKALWMGLAEFQLAWPFVPVQIDGPHEFIDRWANWFADAAQGKLQHPSTMPERPTEGSWRRS